MNASVHAKRSACAEQIKCLREMVTLLEAGDDAGFEARFAELIGVRLQFPGMPSQATTSPAGNSNPPAINWPINPGLFVSVGRLTRELHEAMRELRFDEQLSGLAGRDIPDACSRLDYVARVTEEAAHKTLDLVEQCQKLTQDIALATQDLTAACQRAHVNAGSPYALAALVVTADETREHIARGAAQLRERLSRLAQAQEYQDLAGQVIKRVTQLVKNVECALIDLLRASGGAVAARPAEVAAGGLHGPAVAGVTPAAVSQDDADALLAELGF